jgi:hypothetical protein
MDTNTAAGAKEAGSAAYTKESPGSSVPAPSCSVPVNVAMGGSLPDRADRPPMDRGDDRGYA